MNREFEAMKLAELAIDLPADQVSTFLQQRCGSDPDLRVKVERLLE